MDELSHALRVLQESAQRFGLNELAPHLDKAPSTLYGELNPYGSTHKLGLVDGFRILALTGDHAALTLLAQALGYRLTPLNGQPDAHTPEAEACQGYEAVSRFLAAYRMPGRDRPHYTAGFGLLEQAIKELEDVAARWRDEDAI